MIFAKDGSVHCAVAILSRLGKSVGVIDATWSIDAHLSEAAPCCTSSRLARLMRDCNVIFRGIRYLRLDDKLQHWGERSYRLL
jgi:hypothetical protein